MTKKVDTTKILNEILAIDPKNRFIKYIHERIQRDDYRGWRSSQHNRYDMDDVIIILEKIFDVVGTGLLHIPLGDHKNKSLSSEYSDYDKFVNLVSSAMRSKKNAKKEKGTIDSLKKNFFVDFHRMGLIHRFNKKKEEIDPWGRSHVHYVSLTSTGLEFVKNEDISNRFYILTRAIDKLFEDQMEGLLSTIYYSDFRHEKIGIYELMFIFTDPDLSSEEKIDLLKEFRKLRVKRKTLINLIQKYAQPSNFDGNKTIQKDFSNWKNKIQQILYLFRNTIYFDADEKGFTLKIGSLGIVPDVRQRSQTAKDYYFREHNIKKISNFELHHIIPFRYARNKHEFKLIDDYKNLIYLHKNKHKEITRNRDRHVILEIEPDKLQLSDFDNDVIEAANDVNTKYSKKDSILKIMLKHNKALLKSVFEFE